MDVLYIDGLGVAVNLIADASGSEIPFPLLIGEANKFCLLTTPFKSRRRDHCRPSIALLNIYGEQDAMLTLTVTAQVQMITNGRN